MEGSWDYYVDTYASPIFDECSGSLGLPGLLLPSKAGWCRHSLALSWLLPSRLVASAYSLKKRDNLKMLCRKPFFEKAQILFFCQVLPCIDY